MGLKTYFMKKMIQRQMKDAPKDQQEMIMRAVEKNPELFQKIGNEVQEKVKKGGMDQMNATMQVMRKYQKELQEAMK